MKLALFLCLAFAIAVECLWERRETTNVLEDESAIDVQTEASLCVSFCACRNLSLSFFVMTQFLLELNALISTKFERTD